MTPQAICRALDVGRWIGVIAGFGLALRYSPDPADQLHVLAPWLVGSVSGLTGIESVFLGRAAAQLTGYAPSAYQRQSGMSTLALAATALLAFALGWGSAADLAVVAVLLIFLVLSACNHLWSAWRQGNASLRSFTRPATTAALVAATLPIAIPAATTLGRCFHRCSPIAHVGCSLKQTGGFHDAPRKRCNRKPASIAAWRFRCLFPGS